MRRRQDEPQTVHAALVRLLDRATVVARRRIADVDDVSVAPLLPLGRVCGCVGELEREEKPGDDLLQVALPLGRLLRVGFGLRRARAVIVDDDDALDLALASARQVVAVWLDVALGRPWRCAALLSASRVDLQAEVESTAFAQRQTDRSLHWRREVGDGARRIAGERRRLCRDDGSGHDVGGGHHSGMCDEMND